MLRRHFMTKVGYIPNIIVKYHADKKIHLFNDDNVNKIEQDIYYQTSMGDGSYYRKLVLVNNNFDYGIGYWEIYSQICEVDNTESLQYGKKLIALFCNNYSYEKRFYEDDEYITFINMNINILTDEDVYFIYGDCDSLNLNKLILPSNLLKFNFVNPFNRTNLQKIIIPPNVDIYSNNSSFKNKNNENIELIFTGNKVPKFAYHKNDIIKCPPNLVDKYKEYYPNAIAANNILYIKKVTQDEDKNIKFNNNRNVDNELYISKNYTNDGYTEINIINYDDFESNSSNIGVYSDTGGTNINYDYITEIILPENITTLNYQFIGKNITKLTIPKNVTKINNYLGNFCILEENFINLSSATIPYELTNKIIKNGKEENNCVIDEFNELVFVRDGINRRIIIPDYVTKFKSPSLFNQVDIDYVFISKNITNKTSFSYTNCIIEVSEENKKYDSRDNCNSMIETATNALVAGNKISTIPDSVEIIRTNAFFRADFEKDYILNLKNVKTIETNAFTESGYRGVLYIPKTLELFYGNSFNNCYISEVNVDKENTIYNDYNNSNIVVETATNTLIFVANYNNKNIVIPNGIKIINDYAICQWYQADSIFIPKSVVEFKNNIIDYRVDLKDIIYEGTIEEWNNINKPSNWYSPYYIDSYTIHCSDGDIVINKS